MIIEIKKDVPLVPFHKHWQFCVGSPHATYALRKDYFEHLKLVHDELGIQRVRFHGIFCDDMHTMHKMSDVMPLPGAGNYSEQSFRWCAVAYDNVLAAGMKPFVELGFMPRDLAAKKKHGMFFYKPNISPPKDLTKWTDYVQSFVRFLIDRYGLDEVRQWYFEVWNEPDLKIPFFAGTQKDYFELYATTVKAIKEIDGSLMVGGPATSGSKWVPELLAFCKEQNVPIDFVTTHMYAGDPLGGVESSAEKEDVKFNFNALAAIKLKKQLPHDSLLPLMREVFVSNEAPNGLSRDALIKSAVKAKKDALGLPVYYTEWNMCATFSAPCNDTRMQAAYIVHAVLGTQDTIDGSSIWCFTDLFEELHPFPEEFHGGFGMVTQSGIKKPTFHALKFLNEAYGTRVDLPVEHGGVDVAVFKGEQGYQILLSKLNFSPGNKKAEITLRVAAEAEPSAVMIRRIDETHGNPLKLWQAMDSPQVPNKVQVQEISEKSAVHSEAMAYHFENGVLELEARLGDNDICFIEVLL